jgi:hypothetical protein
MRQLYVKTNQSLKPPVCRRYVVNDTTTEKLGMLMSENPNGLLHFRDELSGLFALMRQLRRENDRSFYLEAWTGLSSYTYDRVVRGTLFIPNLTLSVFGGLTPSALKKHLLSPVYEGGLDDGLMQRFQVSVSPDPLDWKRVDRPPNLAAYSEAMAIFTELDQLKIDNAVLRSRAEIPFLRFDARAQEIFNAWFDQVKTRIHDQNNDEHPAVRSHLAKYPSLFASLALIFYLLDRSASKQTISEIDSRAAELALRWCDYLEAHMRRIYAPLIAVEELAAGLLAKRIRSGQLKNGFAARDIYRSHWAGLSDHAVVEGALRFLEELNWLRSIVTVGGLGRPTKRYFINPKLSANRDALGEARQTDTTMVPRQKIQTQRETKKRTDDKPRRKQ